MVFKHTLHYCRELSHPAWQLLTAVPLPSLKVNGIDLRQATHDEAIGVLRLATQRVRLRVFRHQEAYREEDLWDVFSVELRAPPGEGLGFATIGKWYAGDANVGVDRLKRMQNGQKLQCGVR